VRRPGTNFAAGLTTVDLGVPIYERALEQHEAYCAALERGGLQLIRLDADERFPDSTFVEDTAVLTRACAILAYPGAPSRAGEVTEIASALAPYYSQVHSLQPPGTLDGGDVCEVGDHFFIGISARTNEAGAGQLSAILAQAGYTSQCIDIRGVEGILHLKSGIAALSHRRLVVIDALAPCPEFQGYDLVPVSADEKYGANCVEINSRVLIAAGFPILAESLRELGYETIALDMSEFQKMDGGLSCLSLRF